ncbi:2-aminoethylphosphonate--pyruvate transaminase [Paraburkholderia ribeironis]|uniref:2-aminoethylphosphonate--pyruvate transaminase n=1 Tax=Paraburkholderia ribeironis TaxID=1247936 RepID=A0A1N7S875_9BURK|nr:2-aminoethylphosphonate--pyruvate transaminase [Paraburkholderia ribeironis]SIT43522.1 2-aminoethylphosphonate--pyruvate transaminase [Paraburkholderia ribeironis]
MTRQHTFLMTPGPLALNDEVKAEMQYDIGSRDPSFKKITARVRDLIIDLVGGQGAYSAIPMQGGGSYGIEAALASFVATSDRPLVCINGIYGERMLRMLQLRGIHAVSITAPSDRSLPIAEIATCLESDPEITHVCFVHCETTTGVVNPIGSIVELARQNGVRTIIDAMSSFGGMEISARQVAFDVLVTSSNKCIEGPPGVSFVIASLEMLNSNADCTNSFVLDVRDQWRSFEKNGEWRSTPPTHIVQACAKALERLAIEGVVRRGERYSSVRDAIIRATDPYASPLLKPHVRSPVCLALTAGDVIHTQKDLDALYAHLVDYNLYIYTKLHLPTRSFRIGCMGSIDPMWIRLLEIAFEDFFNANRSVQRPSPPPKDRFVEKAM